MTTTSETQGPPLTAHQDYVILIELLETEKMIGSFHVPDSYAAVPQEGRVLAIGPLANSNDLYPEDAHIQVGDIVIYSRYSGIEYERTTSTRAREKFIFIRRKDIIGTVEV